MKKSDVYEIVVKIFGIWMVWISLSILPSFMWVFQVEEIPMIIFGFLTPIASILFTFFLLFKTKNIVAVISQPEDFSEEYNFNINSMSLYYLSLIILGLFLIIDTLPSIAYDINSWWQMNKYHGNYAGSVPETKWFFINAIKLAFGMLFLVSHKRIAPWIMKLGLKQNKDDENN